MLCKIVRRRGTRLLMLIERRFNRTFRIDQTGDANRTPLRQRRFNRTLELNQTGYANRTQLRQSYRHILKYINVI